MKKQGNPGVSGVLPICLEDACKAIPALQGLDKKYVGVMRLHKDVDDITLHAAVKKFIGVIKQKPPVKSAVARKEREREVYSMEILDRKGRDVCVSVHCQAGTYIRKLFDDIGRLIGGAHMKELRRVAVGNFTENDAHKIQDVAQAYSAWKNGSEEIRKIVLPIERAVVHLKKITVKESAVRSVANGSPVYVNGVAKMDSGISKDELIAVFSGDELIALARFAGEKGMVAKTDRVIKSL
ncbi:MAG: RNA-guided pseudouridylation complex pseudouridine synthase subunit Cbf5 [Candidatus Aenigmarchaeota archaeon]|nr:RNA-guided pseudouridylation complex pseudouridine synthase subunit Cbf5 [Candidatus Aenigmarchaeota archaeon]